MSQNSIKLLYRYLCKNIELQSNRNLFKNYLRNEIENFKNLQNKNKSKKEEQINNYIKNYIQMRRHIDAENALLESYNINIVRDSKREIESVARKVGLEI